MPVLEVKIPNLLQVLQNIKTFLGEHRFVTLCKPLGYYNVGKNIAVIVRKEAVDVYQNQV
jgi:hypothetical protein